MTSSAGQPAEVRARKRARALTDLVWHVGAFVITNAFLWMLDLFLGQEGAQWAYWVTAAWGFALAFHVLSYLVSGRQMEERKAQQYLEQERDKEST